MSFFCKTSIGPWFVVVDSSGSNDWNDPQDLRITAAQETLERLVSQNEAQANGGVADLAAAVDFDTRVTILSALDDPDPVISTLSAIDSNGGTDIALGIHTAINLLEAAVDHQEVASLTNRAAICVFTDGENDDGVCPVIEAIARAIDRGIRVHYGFLSPLQPKNKRSDQDVAAARKICGSGLPSTIQAAVLASGGVFARIGDPASQLAFINQLEDQGLANSDKDDPGGQYIVGQTDTADSLSDPEETRAFTFDAGKDEVGRIVVNTNGSFIPFLTIFDQGGNIIATALDEDGNGYIDLPITFPATGTYVAEVISMNGAVGPFSIYADVANVRFLEPEELKMALNPQTGLYEQCIRLTNTKTETLEALTLTISGLDPDTVVYNATGEDDTGQAVIQYNHPLPGGQAATFLIEYLVPNRGVAPAPTIDVSASVVDVVDAPIGSEFDPGRVRTLNSGSNLVEFEAQPGNRYFIMYTDDTDWHVAFPGITATGTRVQWLDNGPPKTMSHPSVSGNRRYRILEQN